MKKHLLIVLLMVFVCGCAPLVTFEQKRELGLLSKEEGRRCTVEERPEWENKIKEEVLRGNIVKDMTLEQAKAAAGRYCSRLAKNDLFQGDGTCIYKNDYLVLLDTDSSGRSTYSMPASAASVDGQTEGHGEYYLYFYQGRLERWSYTTKRFPF